MTGSLRQQEKASEKRENRPSERIREGSKAGKEQKKEEWLPRKKQKKA